MDILMTALFAFSGGAKVMGMDQSKN
ncbi:Hypothetical protein F387_00921 [Wohlfahrtiimonas chitiniclastica SH04]|uniref:Uncharacterized protein n=1 Tax=Wohlfahrtiimonas chitiniclastica SH04 TaxID=1261130 RepID=L8Y1Y7_9GAMM|nr:Hypothetical protein F387_00921 [Wohlfahrtiimonas chitiniclastica SH04]